MRFWQVLAAGVFSFVKVRNSVKAQAVYAEIEPEIADFLDGIVYRGVIEIQVRLM